MAEAITLASLDADLKNYTLDHKEYFPNKMWQIGLEGVPGTQIKPMADFAQLLDADGTKVLSKMTTSDPLQPGNKDAFNPKAYASLSNRKVSPEFIKVDQLYSETRINELYNTYLARVRGGKYDPFKLPFEEFLLQNLAMDVQKYLRKAFWMGDYNAAGTTSLDLFDGIVKILADDLAAVTPKVNVADIAVITASNAVAQFELIADELSTEQAMNGNNVMIVSHKHSKMYNRDFRDKFGKYTDPNSMHRYIEDTNIEIIVDQWVEAFDTPFITTRENMVMLLDDSRMANVRFDVDERLRNIAFLMDFRGGAGVRDLSEFTLGVVPA